MITITETINALKRFFEATAKARMNSTLLGMGRERVEEFGYSHEALRAGPSAWPWHKATQDSAAEREIQGVADRQLDEIDIPRQDIKHALRDDRFGIKVDQDAA